ncbi:MAG: ATP-dependent RecD-like DNA helicase [Nitrospirae bacterium]|uniref:SF1B family DNA helicase RecD2 n=1 Tax=Candidatus Magnetobacterium casense TaxID=1455061 RepID=UPI00058DD46D|nr:ATP-dependent RecD-like DNA helicase [Candidatus Magnetobacterium casensis]MBF0336528.1 ATP-dependent RecD-like DNA helicase [Nitrospirota bacterium]
MYTQGTDIELQGQVERLTYCNEENGFTIARLTVPGRRDVVTISGALPGINAGEELRLKGEWVNHKKYGMQFKVNSYQSVTPATTEGIKRYLGSGLIKGIGPVLAKRLVDRFDDETLNVIDTHAERLKEVEGIGDKRVEKIRSAWAQQRDIRDIMMFLQGHGVSATYATKIFKQYGGSAIKRVRDNPYQLATDIHGIGFITADKIAQKLGFSKDSELRAAAGILYVLYELSNDGHVYYPYELLMAHCGNVLEVGGEILLEPFDALVGDNKLIVESLAAADPADSHRGVYLARYHVSECGIAAALLGLMQVAKFLRAFSVDKAIAWVQSELSISLADNQVAAVKAAIAHKVLVITGGPGTGKTTIINAIIKLYQQLHQRVLLTAPTGRAAKRMQESTGCDARTLHRLLEFSPKSGTFKRNEQTPLDADLVVVDEASMIDTVLMYHFLRAVPRRATLIIVGDTDQLPSVGPGNVLADIISAGTVPSVRLKEIFRQSQQSRIVVNAHRVNIGEMPSLSGNLTPQQDFCFIEAEDPEVILKHVVQLCKDTIPQRYRLDPMSDIQVLTAMHKGTLGATTLNAQLQQTLNTSTTELIRGGRVFKVGDKVMQTVNNYDKDVYNGDIGVIQRIKAVEHELIVQFDGRDVTFDFIDLDEIVLAYAISIHKAQGSEYPAVVIPIHTQQFIMLQRNLLYTAITRARRLVVLVGSKRAIAIAVTNNKTKKRYTYLKNRLL